MILSIGRFVFGGMAAIALLLGLGAGLARGDLGGGLGAGVAMAAIPAMIFGLTYVKRVF